MHVRAVGETWMRRVMMVALAASSLVAAGCGGGGGGDDAGTPPSPDAPPANGPGQGGASLKIGGSPVTHATVGQPYSFTPEAQANGGTVAFSVENRPEWATFDTVTGTLSGTPTAKGQYANIVITVSDGVSQAALPPFTIEVIAPDEQAPPPSGPVPAPTPGAVTLQWSAPTQSVGGEALTDLAGYRIHYGKTEGALTHSIDVPTVGTSTFMVENLEPGTYYFAVRAYTSSGEQSALSNVLAVEVG